MEHLSNEQLLTYIKKQKAKIKQLEIAGQNSNVLNDAHKHSVINSNGMQSLPHPTVFWESVSKENELFYRNLAKMALSQFGYAIEKNSKNYDMKLCFLLWKLYTLTKKSSEYALESKQLKDALAQSEQKIAKLKTLLARTHNSKQVSLS